MQTWQAWFYLACQYFLMKKAMPFALILMMSIYGPFPVIFLCLGISGLELPNHIFVLTFTLTSYNLA